MDYTFDNIEGHCCNSKLSKINRENTLKANKITEALTCKDGSKSLGYLYLFVSPTGLGKTYTMAAFTIDKLISIVKSSYMPNIKKVIKYIEEFFSWTSKIQGFKKSKQNLTKIATKVLKKIDNGKLWDNKKSTYNSFMDDLTNYAQQINNIIQESAAKDSAKKHAQSMYNKIASIAKKEIKRKPVIIITDTKDNLKGFHDEVHKLIDKDERLMDYHRSFLKSQILYLEANPDQINNLFDTTITELINSHFAENKKLNDIFYLCKERKKLKDQNNTSRTTDDFKKSCEDLNRELLNCYRNLLKQFKKTNEEVPVAITNAIIEIFPATKFVNFDASVIFMTTDKYLNPITHSNGRFSFRNEYNNYILIIDEFDKQESVFARNIIKGEAYKIINGFDTVYKLALPSKMNNSPRYKGVKEIMQPAIDKIAEVAASNFKSEYKWDVDENLTSYDPIQLFSSQNILSTLVVNGRLRNKGKDNKNITDWVDATAATEDQHVHLITCKQRECDLAKNNASNFPNVIIERGLAYLSFLSCLKKAVYKIYNNDKNIDAKRASFTDAIDSLLYYYNISGIKKDVMCYINNNGFKNITSETTLNFNDGFHKSGFNYLRVTREGACVDGVEFENYDLPMSATGSLMQIVANGAEVIGISATADAKTVLHNFDYYYLKNNLDKRFIELCTTQKQQIYEIYKNQRNYKGNGIKINIGFLQPNTGQLFDLYDDVNTVKAKIKATFDEIPDNEIESMVNNRMEQLSRLLQSIDKFIQNKNTKYMLCLCSRNIGKHDNEKEIIEKARKKYAGNKESNVFIYYINAEAIKKGVFDAACRKLQESVTNKVIIISSYPSFGAGKNPQYIPTLKADIEKLINVNNEYKSNRASDIDSLYLDLPTSLFPAGDSKNKYMDTITRLTCMYYLMCLAESGVIKASQIKYFLKQAMADKLRDKKIKFFLIAYASKTNFDTFNNSSDYIAAVIKYIEQAVGRMPRSSYKRQTINIFADYRLAEILAQDTRGCELMTHEYVALRSEAKRFIEQSTDKSSLSFPTEIQLLQNAACNSNIKIYLDLMKLVKSINNNTRYEDNQHLQENSRVRAREFENIAKKLETTKNISYEIITNVLSAKQSAIEDEKNTLANLINTTRKCKKNDYDVNETKKLVVSTLYKKATKVIDEAKAKAEQSNTTATRWLEIREFILANPTLSSLDKLPNHLKNAYIKVPKKFRNKEKPSYKFKGNPDVLNGIYYYLFFDGFSSSQFVSAEAARLSYITSNSIVKKHFEAKGYATKWKDEEYMLAPFVFTNFYRPAIAEQACEALLISTKYFYLEAMPKGLEEKFDYIIVDRRTGKKALLDVKFWELARLLKIGTATKINKVTELTGINKVIYMNIIDFIGNNKVYYTDVNSKKTTDKSKEIIMVVPGIMDNNAAKIISQRMQQIRKFINN